MAGSLLQFPRIRFPFQDSFKNLLAGFGVPGRDKTAHQRFVLQLLDPEQLNNAYRGDWIARKVVDIPPFDACRMWREWQADQEQIEQIEGCERAFGVQRKLMWALSKARLYGGAAMIMGIEGQKFEDELDPETVQKDQLKFLHVCTKWNLAAGDLVRDITSPWFGEPTYYFRSNQVTPPAPGGVQELETSTLGQKIEGQIYIHPSRVIRLVGLDYPDWETAPDQWGDSALQPVLDAIQHAGLVSSSIAAMISEAKLDVIKVPGLMEMLSTLEGSEKVFSRFSQGNVAKSVVNATLLDTTEEWERIQLSFSGMDGVMAMYLSIAAGAADIPATRLLGRSPEGMNATGDSDMRNYYDRIKSDQVMRIQPLLTRLDEVLLRHVFGDRDPDIYYEWAPLWQASDVEKAAIALQKAQAFQIDVNAALINPDVLRQARANQLIEDGTYPGIEAAIDEFELEPEEDDHELAMQGAELGMAEHQGNMNEKELKHSDLDMKMKQAQIKAIQKGASAAARGGTKKPFGGAGKRPFGGPSKKPFG